MSSDDFRVDINVPESVGYWILPGSTQQGGVVFHVFEKPNWFHRKFMKIFLGWGYKSL